MCDRAAIHTDLRVSIQLRNVTDRAEGFVAAGILSDSYAVLLPEPAALLSDTWHEMEVLVIPVDPEGGEPQRDAFIERFVLKKFMFFRREQDSAPGVAVLILDGDSRYGSQMGECDAEQIGRALETYDGDWWAALSETGIIPPRIRRVSAGLLRKVTRAEQRQRRPRTSECVSDSYAEMAKQACCPSCCHCKAAPGDGNGSE